MPFRAVAPTSEPGEVESDRLRRGPFAQHDVKLEVLHRRIEHDRSGKSVDLVDEEDIASVQVGEDRGQVAGAVEGGPEVTRIFTSTRWR